MEATVYNQKGKESGKISLPEKVFSLPRNDNLVHQVAVSMSANMRAGTAHAKGRGEVAGGGKKPWQQKGLGRARHGSIRSPIWKGGGVTHGPLSEKNYGKKINKKMRAKALFTVLSEKLRGGEVIFVDSISVPEGKTSKAKEILSNLAKGMKKDRLLKKKNAAFIALPERDEMTIRSFRNIGNVKLDDIRNINVLDALNNSFVVLTEPEKSVKILESRMK